MSNTASVQDQLQADLLDIRDRLNVAAKAMSAEPATQEHDTFLSISQMLRREGEHVLELLQQLENSRK